MGDDAKQDEKSVDDEEDEIPVKQEDELLDDEDTREMESRRAERDLKQTERRRIRALKSKYKGKK